MLGLTESHARELGLDGIRINTVAPSTVLFGAEERVFGDRLQDHSDSKFENQSIKQRIALDAVVGLVPFLANPHLDMIASQKIGIDGGW